jgi:2,4-dienoyl-CoA reductase-like NADH-dependent reductase (Old Yellow Enzyme family)
MTEDGIMEVIKAFGAAAKRAVEAGADGIQLHVAAIHKGAFSC